MHSGKKGAEIIVFLKFFLCQGEDKFRLGSLVLGFNT